MWVSASHSGGINSGCDAAMSRQACRKVRRGLNRYGLQGTIKPFPSRHIRSGRLRLSIPSLHIARVDLNQTGNTSQRRLSTKSGDRTWINQFRSLIFLATHRSGLSGLPRCRARLGRSPCLDIDCLSGPYDFSRLSPNVGRRRILTESTERFQAAWHGMGPLSGLGSWSTISEEGSSVHSIV